MILGEPAKTRHDLRFSVFGLPVRIHPSFWVTAGILAILNLRADTGLVNLLYIPSIISAIVLGILVHELGHSLVARRFGARGVRITLYAMGGLSVGAEGRTGKQRMMVVAAGPLAGILVAAPFFLLLFILAAQPPSLLTQCVALFALWMTFVGFWWAVLNLLPMFPLDGGQLVNEFLSMRMGARARVVTCQVSIVTGIACGILAVLSGFYFAAFFCGYLTFTNYQRLRQMTSGL